MPGWSSIFALLAVQGAVIESVRTFTYAHSSEHYVIAGASVVCILVLLWATQRNAFTCRQILQEMWGENFIRHSRLQKCPRMVQLLLPKGVYVCKQFRWGMWRPLFEDASKSVLGLPSLEMILLAGMIGVLVNLRELACRGLTVVVAVVHFLLPLVYFLLKPHRRPLDGLFLAVMRLVNGVMCLGAVVSIDVSPAIVQTLMFVLTILFVLSVAVTTLLELTQNCQLRVQDVEIQPSECKVEKHESLGNGQDEFEFGSVSFDDKLFEALSLDMASISIFEYISGSVSPAHDPLAPDGTKVVSGESIELQFGITSEYLSELPQDTTNTDSVEK